MSDEFFEKITIDDIIFFKTRPQPCPYLPGLEETKVLTNLKIKNAEHVYTSLLISGFRRSQTIAYKPMCMGCVACQSIRIIALEFIATKSLRRIDNLNHGLKRFVKPPYLTFEHYNLFRKYITVRHSGEEMANMGEVDVRNIVEQTTIDTVIIEYREYTSNTLVGWVITDMTQYGPSMVYSVFDPDYEKNSLGTFSILDHIRFARELSMPYVFLGYWVKNCKKMSYKKRFYPHELQIGNQWIRFDKK